MVPIDKATPSPSTSNNELPHTGVFQFLKRRSRTIKKRMEIAPEEPEGVEIANEAGVKRSTRSSKHGVRQ